MTLAVVCTWGDGPDVMIVQTWQKPDEAKTSYIDLAIEQIPQFIQELLTAYTEAVKIDQSYQTYQEIECSTNLSNTAKNTENLFAELKQ